MILFAPFLRRRGTSLFFLMACAGFVLLFGCATPPEITRGAGEETALRLVRAYPVIGSGGAREPSGLTLHEGRLFAVCDKVGNTVFRIDLDNGTARMVPHIRFDPPPGIDFMDFEGITVDDDGNFFLVSETYSRILKVTPGGKASWHFGSVEAKGRAVGLLQRRNAKLEGIALLPGGNFLLAAERQPRGLMELDGQTGEIVHAQVMNSTLYSDHLPLLRIPDWTGLFVYDERVFALFRNAHMVVPLDRDEEGNFSEGTGARSFQHVEESSEYRYDDLRFGKAEGLAMDDRFIYVILDNNGRPRAVNRSDRRPLLFVFENPFSLKPMKDIPAPHLITGLLRP